MDNVTSIDYMSLNEKIKFLSGLYENAEKFELEEISQPLHPKTVIPIGRKVKNRLEAVALNLKKTGILSKQDYESIGCVEHVLRILEKRRNASLIPFDSYIKTEIDPGMLYFINMYKLLGDKEYKKMSKKIRFFNIATQLDEEMRKLPHDIYLMYTSKKAEQRVEDIANQTTSIMPYLTQYFGRMEMMRIVMESIGFAKFIQDYNNKQPLEKYVTDNVYFEESYDTFLKKLSNLDNQGNIKLV